MPTAIHSFSQEEMMAYLDGELSADRALAAAQHLEQCRECQRLAADFQSVSHRLADWEIEANASAAPQVTAEASKKPKRVFWSPAWVLGAGSVTVLMVIGAALFTRSNNFESRLMVSDGTPRYDKVQSLPLRNREVARDFIAGSSNGAPNSAGMLGGVLGGVPGPPPPSSTSPTGPMIVRTAQLTLMSNNFDQSRAEVERIVEIQRGYISQLQFNAPNGLARTLQATLRVPAEQLDTTLQELRRLGHVDEESQGGEDVTQRYVDINARLSNLRTTEDRLLQILRERTGKLGDVLQVEEAVDRTRGDIETTEAEQKLLSSQLALASLNVTVTEEYKAPLARSDSSVVTQLRNAAVEGCRNVVELATGVLGFLLSTGPALLILAAIAFFPARWLWRRRQPQ